MNFLKETIEFISDGCLNTDDIVFIGSIWLDYGCTWEEFKIIADFDYSNGYGIEHIATDLWIGFRCGSRMYRKGRDGKECWEWCSPDDALVVPESKRKILNLGGDDYNCPTLEDLNE